jgi:hypothetical protein
MPGNIFIDEGIVKICEALLTPVPAVIATCCTNLIGGGGATGVVALATLEYGPIFPAASLALMR